jgi:MFS family permease
MPPITHYEEQIKKNFRFNFAVNVGDVAAFMFGSSFMSVSTVLPIYIIHFTNNPILIGLISVIASAGFLLPQIFTANIVERAPIKKFFPFNLGLFLERIPVMLLAPTTFFLATTNPTLALIVFFLLISWQNFGAGALMVGWQDMIAKIIPVENRGKFFGISNFVGNFSGILGAATVSWLLTNNAFPNGFVIAFACAATFNMISWGFLGLTREPRDPETKPHVSHSDYFKALPAVIGANRNFRNYLITQIFSVLGSMAAAFLLVYSLQKWNLSDGQAASYSIALLLAQSISNLLLGFLADRTGHKFILEISIGANILSFLLALIAPSPTWFYAIFALRGVNLAGNFISGMSLPLEFSEPMNRPTYIGLASTIAGVAGALAPIIAGTIASTTGYPTLFTISAIIAMVALILMHWLVREPRHAHKSPLIPTQIPEL